MEHKCPYCHQSLVPDRNNAGKLLCYNCKNRYDKTDIMRIEGEKRATNTSPQPPQPPQPPQAQQTGYVNTTYTKTTTDSNGEQHSETYNTTQQFNNGQFPQQQQSPYYQAQQQQPYQNYMPQNIIPDNNYPMQQNYQQMPQAPVKKKSGLKIAIIIIVIILLVFGALTFIASKTMSSIADSVDQPSDILGTLNEEVKPLTDEQITINGKTLTIGESTVKDLVDTGIFDDAYVYDYDIDDNKDIKSILSNAITGDASKTPIADVNVKADESQSCTLNTKDNNTFVSIRYKNTGETDKKATDCMLTTLDVYTLSSLRSDPQQFDDRFVFPNGVKLGDSRDDVFKAYGEPNGYYDDSYNNDSNTKYLHYRLGTSVSKDITLDDEKVTSFSISDWRYEF